MKIDSNSLPTIHPLCLRLHCHRAASKVSDNNKRRKEANRKKDSRRWTVRPLNTSQHEDGEFFSPTVYYPGFPHLLKHQMNQG